MNRKSGDVWNMRQRNSRDAGCREMAWCIMAYKRRRAKHPVPVPLWNGRKGVGEAETRTRSGISMRDLWQKAWPTHAVISRSLFFGVCLQRQERPARWPCA